MNPMNLERIATAVHRAITDLPISQRQLARQAGLSQATVQQLASGDKVTTTAETAVAIAEGLEAEVGELRAAVAKLETAAHTIRAAVTREIGG